MHESSSFLKGDQLDSIMNYPFKGAMIDFFGNRSINAEEFDDILAKNRVIYMDDINRQLWNLIGSHDTSRFLTECEEKNRANEISYSISIYLYWCTVYILW